MEKVECVPPKSETALGRPAGKRVRGIVRDIVRERDDFESVPFGFRASIEESNEDEDHSSGVDEEDRGEGGAGEWVCLGHRGR